MSLCPKANLFVGVVVWALPRSFCFAVSLAKRKSGWGICGSSWFSGCGFLCCCCDDLPLFMDQSSPCTNSFSLLTFLTGPSLSATSAKPEEKKIVRCTKALQAATIGCFFFRPTPS